MRSGSAIAVDSVISTTSGSGRRPSRSSWPTSLLGQVGLPQLPRRQVERRRQVEPCARHSRACRHSSSSTQSPIASIRPELLGERDELAGGDQAAASGRCQRSSASTPDHRAVAQVHDRLVVQHPVLSRSTAWRSRVGRTTARSTGRRALAGVDAYAARAASLALVHRRVGVAASASSASCGVLREQADADRRRDEELACRRGRTARRAPRACGRDQLGHDQRAWLGRRRPRVQVGEQHQELVAALPRHQVGVARAASRSRSASCASSWSPAA